jgi:hypothetical protein
MMSTVQEVEAAAARLSRSDLIRLRAWLDDQIEDELVVRDEVLALIGEARAEIARGASAPRVGRPQ